MEKETDANLKAHYKLAYLRIQKPELITLPKPVVMAPGSPIGCDVD